MVPDDKIAIVYSFSVCTMSIVNAFVFDRTGFIILHSRVASAELAAVTLTLVLVQRVPQAIAAR